MAARHNPSAGKKPDKLIRDALMVAVKRVHDHDGKKMTYLNRIAATIVKNAANGDVAAYKELFDRIEGKPAQSLAIGQDENSGPLVIRWESD